MQPLLTAIEKTIKPAGHVVGVNLLTDAAALAETKVRLSAEPLAVCQQVAYSRLYGWSTWCDAAHSHCVLGAANCGLIETPERVRSGQVNRQVYQKDASAAASMQSHMPRLAPGRAGLLTYAASRSSGDAGGCARGIAQVLLEEQPVVEVPCLGDRRFAMAQDHEMIVAVPAAWFDATAEGLVETHRAGIRYPIPFQLPAHCDLPEPFQTCDEDLDNLP